MGSNEDFQVVIGSLISSASTDYVVHNLLGKGTFGAVVRCKKLATGETVALKILRSKRYIAEAKDEATVLKIMKTLNSENFNIVRWNDAFDWEGRYCLEFEKLDMSLHEFLQMRESHSLVLKEIRPIMQQLATALEFLKRIGFIHADLKPVNIMMVDHLRQPLKVKVIDFGLALNNPSANTGVTLQTAWYRSPEIILGAPFSEAIDVWSLGCIAAEMFIGTILFPGTSEYDMMRRIFYTIGTPPDHLLNAGQYTRRFFNAKYGGLEGTLWRFMSTFEVRHFTCTPLTITDLSDLMKVPCKLSGDDARVDECDREIFVDLVMQMLKVDACERITPSQILQHPFITMSHFVDTFNNNLHVKSCIELMSTCQDLTSDNGKEEVRIIHQMTEEPSNSTASPVNYSVLNEGHPPGLCCEEQPILASTVVTNENSSTKKRKRAVDDVECRSPNTILAKKRRSEGKGAALIETGGKTGPQKSPQQKRKRDDTDLCVTSAEKKRRCTILENVPADSVQKILCNSEGAQSFLTQVSHLKKSKRDHEEASGSNMTSPDKRRRRSVESNQFSFHSDPVHTELNCLTQVTHLKKRKRDHDTELN